MSLQVFALVLAWQQNFELLHNHMHGDCCSLAFAVSGVPGKPCEGAAHTSFGFVFSLDPIPSNAKNMWLPHSKSALFSGSP